MSLKQSAKEQSLKDRKEGRRIVPVEELSSICGETIMDWSEELTTVL